MAEQSTEQKVGTGFRQKGRKSKCIAVQKKFSVLTATIRKSVRSQKAVDSVTVGLGDRSIKDLRHFEWIRPVILECVHFSKKKPMRREDYLESNTRFMEDPN